MLTTRGTSESELSAAIGRITNTQESSPSPVVMVVASTRLLQSWPPLRRRISRSSPIASPGYRPSQSTSASDGHVSWWSTRPMIASARVPSTLRSCPAANQSQAALAAGRCRTTPTTTAPVAQSPTSWA